MMTTLSTFKSWKTLVESELTTINEPKAVAAEEEMVIEPTATAIEPEAAIEAIEATAAIEAEATAEAAIETEATPTPTPTPTADTRAEVVEAKDCNEIEQEKGPEQLALPILSLTFQDFMDVQTRLVLLPCIEEEGIGAIVASFTPNESEESTADADSINIDIENATLIGIRGFSGTGTGGTGTGTDLDAHSSTDWRRKDFTDILSAIRQANTPIVLLFHKDNDYDNDDEEQDLPLEQIIEQETIIMVPEDSSTSTTNQPDPESSTLERLASWGSRVRATAQVAASAVATAATEATKERRVSVAPPIIDPLPPTITDKKLCNLFMQTCFDKFQLLSSASTKLTTASVVVVRMSEIKACPVQGYSFQWFRSVKHSNNTLTLSSSSHCYTQQTDMEWTLLKGATYAAYQPTATDVGHRVKCIVTLMENDEKISCETTDCIYADMALFNAARQALLRGAQFSNLIGRGNASGRIFRVHIEIAITDNIVSSATTISQVSGSTSEPLHSSPILQISALSDPCNPKYFDLIFPKGLPNSMVQVLASDDGRLQLEAPNRLTRETLLLSLGIANFTGKPAELTSSTILFHGQKDVHVTKEGDAPLTPEHQHMVEPSEFFTPLECGSSSVGSRSNSPESALVEEDDRVRALELELQRIMSKMSRKDKVVSELQRQLAQSESQRLSSTTSLMSCQQELKRARDESKELVTTIDHCHVGMESQDARIQNFQEDHALNVGLLESRIQSQSEKIAELTKSVRSLQNEKAVLAAGIDAREQKLSNMAELQETVEILSRKVAKSHAVSDELKELQQRYKEQTVCLQQASSLDVTAKQAMDDAQGTIQLLTTQLEQEQKKNALMKVDCDEAHNTQQMLKSERNNYKQKADSLGKEIAQLCRKGRTFQDVLRILADDESRMVEVQILKEQKKKVQDELTEYRIAYHQSLVTQLKSSKLDGSAMKAMEKTCELERVILELTEYVQAKEMQLDTMMQVNQALAEEVTFLAKANMDKRDI